MERWCNKAYDALRDQANKELVKFMSEVLGVPCEVKALDVIEIADTQRDQNGKTVTRPEEEVKADTQQEPPR